MHFLPEQLGNLTALEVISVKSNELDLLPQSIVQCTALKKINFQDNHLRRLPQELGTLPQLEVLSVAANSMKTLPYSLGFTKTLKEFIVSPLPPLLPLRASSHTPLSPPCRSLTILSKTLRTGRPSKGWRP
jgi:Leucine-rich repeat (LRR) protein